MRQAFVNLGAKVGDVSEQFAVRHPIFDIFRIESNAKLLPVIMEHSPRIARPFWVMRAAVWIKDVTLELYNLSVHLDRDHRGNMITNLLRSWLRAKPAQDPLAERSERRNGLRVACTVMLKDERVLIEPFLRYHAELFGAENLYVIDNGSTDPVVLDILTAFEQEGVHIDRSHPTMDDYRNKGGLIADLVKRLDSEVPYDFYVLLDCDEFVVLRQADGFTCAPTAIRAYLESMLGEQRILRVATNLSNIPGTPDAFREDSYAKTIFPRGVLLSTDHGHHVGQSRTGAGYVDCDIAYMHFHYRSYEEVSKFARQKLSMAIPVEDLDDPVKLRAYTGPGHHMVGYLLAGAEAYYRQFRSLDGAVRFPELLERFKEIGTATPFSDIVLPTEARPGHADSSSLALVVDNATTTRVRGWAVDLDRPERQIHLRFLVDDALIWEGTCDGLRLDVRKDGHGTGYAGFDFAITELETAPPHMLRIEDIFGHRLTFMRYNMPMTEMALDLEQVS